MARKFQRGDKVVPFRKTNGLASFNSFLQSDKATSRLFKQNGFVTVVEVVGHDLRVGAYEYDHEFVFGLEDVKLYQKKRETI